MTRPIVLSALVMASVVIGRSLTVVEPGLHDAQLFHLIGQAWAGGHVPYRDLWDNKPPGIFLLAALGSSADIQWTTAVALFDAAAVLMAVAAVYLLTDRLRPTSTATAPLAALSTALALNLSVLNEGGFTTELFVAPFSALSMLAFAGAWVRARSVGYLSAGASAGAAALFKLPGLAPLLAQITFLALIFVRDRTAHRPALLKAAGLLAAGACAAWLPALVYFAAQGAPGEPLSASVVFNLGYGAANQGSPFVSVLRLGRVLVPVASLTLGAVGFCALLVRGSPRSSPLLPSIAFWVIWDLLGIAAGGRFYAHYVLAAVPSSSVAAAMWVDGLRVTSRVRGVIAGLVLLPLLSLLARDTWRLVSGPSAPAPYWVGPVDAIRSSLAEAPAPATLFTWDYLPAVYVHGGLLPTTRYPYIHTYGSPEARSAMSQAVLETLERTPPTFKVDSGGNPGPPQRDTSAFRAYERLLTQQYQLIFEDPLYGLRVFRLAPETEP
jgi:hypothetical protein